MICNITQEDVERHLPTAVDATAEIFEALKPMLETADRRLSMDVVDPDTAQQLADLFEAGVPGTPLPRTPYVVSATIDNIVEEWKATAINEAFAAAIPKLDLVMTQNGFGVVQTQQIAPASKDRVAALRRACLVSAAQHYDLLLLSLAGCAETKPLALKSSTWLYATDHFIRTVGECRAVATRNDQEPEDWTLADLWAWRPRIETAEFDIEAYIGKDERDALISSMRESTVNAHQEHAIRRIRALISAMIGFDIYAKTGVRQSIEELVGYMEQNPDSFQPYMNSKEYRARHAERYQNKTDDPCYFF